METAWALEFGSPVPLPVKGEGVNWYTKRGRFDNIGQNHKACFQ